MAHLFAQTAAPGRRAAAMKNKKQNRHVVRGSSLRRARADD